MAVIVFEHQSGNLKKIPEKLLRYISAIWNVERKEAKKALSAPYFIVLRFIVLRTGKKPHRGKYSAMSDSIALESLLIQAIQSNTLDEFAEVLK